MYAIDYILWLLPDDNFGHTHRGGESRNAGYFTTWLNARRGVTNIHSWPIYI